MKRFLRMSFVFTLAVGTAWLLSYWLQPETGPPLEVQARPQPVSAPAARAVVAPPPPRISTAPKATPASHTQDVDTSVELDPRAFMSRSWINFIEQELQPAISQARYNPAAYGDEAAQQRIFYAHACYTLAGGKEEHPAWQAFMSWIYGEAGAPEHMLDLCFLE